MNSAFESQSVASSAGRSSDLQRGSPRAAAIGDVNGDGRPDLVVVDPEAAAVHVLLGNRDGGFRAKPDFPTGPQPISLAIADVNRDGCRISTATAGPICWSPATSIAT
jgi:hypothetical protein